MNPMNPFLLWHLGRGPQTTEAHLVLNPFDNCMQSWAKWINIVEVYFCLCCRLWGGGLIKCIVAIVHRCVTFVANSSLWSSVEDSYPLQNAACDHCQQHATSWTSDMECLPNRTKTASSSGSVLWAPWATWQQTKLQYGWLTKILAIRCCQSAFAEKQPK